MVHPGRIEPSRIAAALERLLRGADPATALVTGNAAATVAVIRQLGPTFGETALVGFDDFALADILRPALTVVAQDEATIGRTTIDLFQARLADPTHPVRTVTVPTALIARGSGELPPTC
jgi:LacI family transcriptional regulator